MSNYGSELDFDEDVESQLVEIEQLHQPKVSKSHDGPKVEINYNDSAMHTVEPVTEREKSLWELYRNGGSLSVSDLLGPAWCEYQHIYRLQSKYILRLPSELRPSSFQTPQGKEIAINLRQVEEREVVLGKGNAVHGKLEREVNGIEEKVEIVVQSKEEGWVLRIVNLLGGLKLLATNGVAREIQVVGLLEGGMVVFGIIDQVERKRLPPASVKPPPSAATTSLKPSPAQKKSKKDDKIMSTQTTLDNFFSSPTKTEATPESTEKGEQVERSPDSRHVYVLSDTKTRYNFSLPRSNATKSAQLQLMIYRSFLSPLLTATFPWHRLFTQLGIDPTFRLSELFLLSIFEVLDCNGLLEEAQVAEQELVTLQDFVNFLNSFVKQWFPESESGLSEEMEISYRLRNALVPSSSLSYLPRPHQDLSQATIPSSEDQNLAEAIRLSLLPFTSEGSGNSDEEELARVLAIDWGQDGEELSHRERAEILQEEMDEEEELMPFFPPAPMLSKTGATARGKRREEDGEDAASIGFDAFDHPPNSQVSPATKRYNLRRRPPSSSSNAALPSSPVTSDSPLMRARKASSPSLPPSRKPPPEPIPAGALIGTQTFRYSQKTLDDFLKSSLGLWRGEREPVGVEVEETGRCRTCEFESACEWREKKSREAVELHRENARKATLKRGRA